MSTRNLGENPALRDDEILTVFQHTDDPVLSTADVADELPIKRRATLTRLQRLVESGALDRKQTGGRNIVWWLTGNNRTHGGPAAPLRALIGLENDEGAQRVRKRSREFREEFNDRMDRRRNVRTEQDE